MDVVTEPAHARERFAALARPRGFVPTMGALHGGHLRLIAQARSQCASVAASLFVNPMQFGPQEDYEHYPRDVEGDREKFARAGVDLLFEPDPETIYPSSFSTIVDVGALGTTFEGAIRPDHFRGVATIVTKLLHIVEPDVLYVGQKDAQQAAVISKLVRDLNMPVRVEIVETVREADGLALSSRNAYLSPQERAEAPTLHAALNAVVEALRGGASVQEAREPARRKLSPLARLEYLDVVDARTFAQLETLRAPAFAIGAAVFGRTRLIDNLWIRS